MKKTEFKIFDGTTKEYLGNAIGSWDGEYGFELDVSHLAAVSLEGLDMIRDNEDIDPLGYGLCRTLDLASGGTTSPRYILVGLGTLPRGT